LVQYFYISAQEEDDAGTAGVLSGGDYFGGVFWAWAWRSWGLGAWRSGGREVWGPRGLGAGAWALGLLPGSLGSDTECLAWL